MAAPIRLAVVGTGIFANHAYLPAFKNLADRFEVVAVCNHSRDSAEKYAEALPGKVDVYTDYQQMLSRPDIEAVSLIVPISTLPEMVEHALAANKHVISEKPAAPDVATARKLLALPRNTIWTVAENWPFEMAKREAAELVRSGKIGRPVIFHWAHHYAAQDGRYYPTEWRRNMSFPGGFLLDGGVHHIAVLRQILGEVASVSAFTSQVREDMPPADTMSATLQFENGCVGSYVITYAATSKFTEPLTVVCEKGAFKTGFDWLEISEPSSTGEPSRQQFKSKTIEAELIDFADAIQLGKPPQATPEQSAQNLAVFEALLKAAETGQAVVPEKLV